MNIIQARFNLISKLIPYKLFRIQVFPRDDRTTRLNQPAIEVDEPATEGLGDGITGDWGRWNVFKIFEPWGGNTNPRVSNNVRGSNSSGTAPAASKTVIYSPGYPKVKTSAEQRINDYTGIYTTTDYSKDSSVRIGTYQNLKTGEIRFDTLIHGKNTDTTLSPVMLNF